MDSPQIACAVLGAGSSRPRRPVARGTSWSARVAGAVVSLVRAGWRASRGQRE